MDDYRPSFFNRLTDPTISANRPLYTLHQAEAAVLRDLEDLLNTRRPPDHLFAGLALVPTSIANFGLRDQTFADGATEAVRLHLRDHIQAVINTYEPRLRDVRVTPRDPDDVKAEERHNYRLGALYFRIVATLSVDPTPVEGVIFDTVVELASGHHDVSGPGGRS